ncbi:phosphoribosylamine---glycine ligase [Myxococcaceae bacterium]|nr:phosphoribosylamine---glycine ligase [Myxococcaceae bacterium]
MRVLVVGSGGREHALAWKIARSPRVERVLAVPGSAAMEREAACFAGVGTDDAAALVALAAREAVDLVVVGPEGPLAAGVADRLRDAGLAVFGPGRAAAQLEASKSFAKEFMSRHRIPTAAHASFADLDAAKAHVRALDGPCVVKADGLAAGKGVAVCETPEAALRALEETMAARRFGAAGERVVVEERLEGEEASFYAITDGERVVTLAAAQDHKRALDGDRGENTGGMGAYAPAPVVGPAVEARILSEIVQPTLRGLAADGLPYRGVLFIGLMIDRSGVPRVIEYNVRFGDPETQALVRQMHADLVPLLDGAARGALDPSIDARAGDPAVCVVLASGGYPRAFETGKAIDGIDDAERDPEVVVFHAGTKRAPTGGFSTAGGRVLGVTARGASFAVARERAYAACARIRFEGLHLRRDIGARALARP